MWGSFGHVAHEQLHFLSLSLSLLFPFFWFWGENVHTKLTRNELHKLYGFTLGCLVVLLAIFGLSGICKTFTCFWGSSNIAFRFWRWVNCCLALLCMFCVIWCALFWLALLISVLFAYQKTIKIKKILNNKPNPSFFNRRISCCSLPL